MEKQTLLDQIEITARGVIQVRFCKTVIDGEAVLASQYHRTVFEPGANFDDQVSATNEHLKKMGFPTIADGDVQKLKRLKEALKD